MRRGSLTFLAFVIIVTVIAEDGSQTTTSTAPVELFCTDGVVVYYVSAGGDVVSPSEKMRLRILRMPDGMLLLDMPQLVYAVVPNITPVYESEENQLIMLPDLDIKDAAIGLQLPEGLQDIVFQILHRPPPPEDVNKILTKAESLAAQLVHRAEVVGDTIDKNAVKLQRGDPAGPDKHHRLWRTSFHYLRTATDHLLDFTMSTKNQVRKVADRVGEKVRPILPFYRQTKKVGNTGGESDELAQNLREDMRSAYVKALDTITEALKQSARIVATSIKENTVKVIQHNFGDDITEALGDMALTVRNTFMTRRHLKDLEPETIARNTLRQIIAPRPHVPQQQYTCKEDL